MTISKCFICIPILYTYIPTVGKVYKPCPRNNFVKENKRKPSNSVALSEYIHTLIYLSIIYCSFCAQGRGE